MQSFISPTNQEVRDTESLCHTTRVKLNTAALAEAQTATIKEHQMSLWQGIRVYHKAAGWSILLSTTTIMEGYDNALIGSFYAFPAFQKKYGQPLADGSYGLTAPWQAGLSCGMIVGQILGLLLNGIISERLGYKRTMLASLTAVITFVPILFFAQNIQTLVIGELLLGIPLGVFQTLAVAYASEVCPVVLRCYLATYINLSWVIGQLLASIVLRGLLNNTSQWSYRIPFTIQWVWPVPIIVGVIFAPESPWWLVRKGRIEEATAALRRLTRSDTANFDAKETVSMIVHTNELEKEMSAGTSYWDCFKSANIRRTRLTCFVWAMLVLCGAGLMAYSTYFYEQAGIPTSASFSLSLGQYAIGFFANLFSCYLMRAFGRRSLYVAGLSLLTITLFVIGFLALAGDKTGTSWAIGSLLLVYVFFYNSTSGPVSYSLVAELSSTRLRSKTIVLSRVLYNVLCIVNYIVLPYMLNPTAWNWKGKAGFFWGSTCLLCALWSYFYLPETKGRTYSELDILFEQNIAARKFKVTTVDPFR
ncbi:hypothetical protein EG329_011376 [Mollisiaceae sp. DMI_Dod_QoI]|nr:hypothetical protein EG329_011376 [Helotiales sp. DMI_Dod_QoI]